MMRSKFSYIGIIELLPNGVVPKDCEVVEVLVDQEPFQAIILASRRGIDVVKAAVLLKRPYHIFNCIPTLAASDQVNDPILRRVSQQHVGSQDSSSTNIAWLCFVHELIF